MKISKRILSLAAILAILGLNFFEVNAKNQAVSNRRPKLLAEVVDDEGMCGKNVKYKFTASTGELRISGIGDMDNYNYASEHPWALYDDDFIKSIIIEDGVSSIGKASFNVCRNLVSVYIPESVKSIGDSAFGLCDSLTEIKIPKSVTSIGEYAFNYCSSLVSVEIPDNVISIGDNAFRDCSRLTSINVGQNNNSYKSVDGVLYSKNVETLIKCPEGKSGGLCIPNSVNSIGDYAFYRCNLSLIEIPNNVTVIGDYAFYICMKLESIRIPINVTSIGNYAFDTCTSLRSLEINNDYVVSQLNIIFPKSPIELITLGSTIKNIAQDSFDGLNGLTQINVDENNSNYRSIDGVLFNKNLTALIRFPEGKAGSYTVPRAVDSIGGNAFESCDKLNSVKIPSSVTFIGDNAFSGCTSLSSVAYSGNIEPEHGKNVFPEISENSPLKYVLVFTRYLNKTFCGLPVKIFYATKNLNPYFFKPRRYLMF